MPTALSSITQKLHTFPKLTSPNLQAIERFPDARLVAKQHRFLVSKVQKKCDSYASHGTLAHVAVILKEVGILAAEKELDGRQYIKA